MRSAVRTAILHAASAIAAMGYAMRWQWALRIACPDMVRYYRKSISLSMCYVAFTDGSLTMAIRVGKAGFFCAAYDVVTDWPDYRTQGWHQYHNIVSRTLSPNLVRIVSRLYELDSTNALAKDGLQRGSMAVEFICDLVQSTSYMEEKMDLNDMGELCQIADDILDYEDDSKKNDCNCLLSPGWSLYLSRFLDEFSEDKVCSIFDGGSVMVYVLRRARHKARRLLLDLPSTSQALVRATHQCTRHG